eukprot:5357974-Amphidinium_carterae.1
MLDFYVLVRVVNSMVTICDGRCAPILTVLLARRGHYFLSMWRRCSAMYFVSLLLSCKPLPEVSLCKTLCQLCIPLWAFSWVRWKRHYAFTISWDKFASGLYMVYLLMCVAFTQALAKQKL